MDDFINLDHARSKLLTLVDNFPTTNRKYILKAHNLASKAHTNQVRDEGAPYIIHPIRVAVCLIEELNISDKNTIACALLHDAVEDTDLTLPEIDDMLGKKTAKYVSSLTRDKKKQTKYEKFTEIMKQERNIRAIKACDRLDNVRSWPYIPKSHPSIKKFPRWFREFDKTSLPLAESVDKKLVILMKKALSRAKKY